jgi:hypothetical protein
MEINNFDIIREHLTFEKAKKFDPNAGNVAEINDTYDRYIVQILQRKKDQVVQIGANTSNRLIKTYEISSLEYFDKKKDTIIDLCRSNNARAYILPQVRSTYDCLKEMIKLGVDNLENPTIKFQHILRSCMCSMHKSRDKMWILDCDNDGLTEYIREIGFPHDFISEKQWTVEQLLDIVREELRACGKDSNYPYIVPSRNGCSIVTRPFNLKSAYSKCGLFYEGEHKIGDRKITGILHKDGMVNLYIP